ncbi:hypothetical protein Droror1_Dr00021405 [Drosera rotundifolia]
MATSSFKSTTKRTPIGAETPSSSSSSSIYRRSRSVSRVPETPGRKGKFVNTVRGTEFPEISLDDLAIELFSLSELGGGRERQRERERRGRSVSRCRGSGGEGEKSGRRRRSVSVVRYKGSDSESEGNPASYSSRVKQNGFSDGRKQKTSVKSSVALDQFRRLKNCSSQRDFSKLHDDHSSHSSVLTEDEMLDAPYSTYGMQKTYQADHVQLSASIRADHVQKNEENRSSYGLSSSLNSTRQKEFGNSVQEIKQETRQIRNNKNPSKMIRKNGAHLDDYDVFRSVSAIRKSYASKLEQSEHHKQDLLAEMILEERRGKELKQFVGKSVPDLEETLYAKRQPRARKRNEAKRMPKELIVEEAEKIIDDFISSFEDTDISSIDGERSETSSTIETIMKPPRDYLMSDRVAESFRSPLSSDTQVVEMDGVVLPWLQWETNGDASPLQCSRNGLLSTNEIVPQDKLEETRTSQVQEQSTHSKSSRGSWSPVVLDNVSINSDETISKTAESDNLKSCILSNVPRRPRIDIDSYSKCPSDEEFLFERWKNREMIARGGLLLCHGSFGIIL